MKLYIKTINNKTKVLPSNKIVIIKDGKQIFNPTEEMLLEDGWMVQAQDEFQSSEEEFVQREKECLSEHILKYDSSDQVNIFYVNDLSVWLDKATRAGLLLRFQAEKARSLTDTTLWYNGVQFSLNIEQAIQMLYSLELYASQCYDNTQRHLAEIENLKTIEELQNYNYTTGYPEKLQFNF